ncbi:putative DNA modification/repair radical SAM protein [bacterium D16-51]|nr:putative DNA modification/repair radical SAM protein [bacterium D16-59]RKI61161.1 putative DNA modification/repair radical SAM protein [bacterium D16-51]
MIFQEHATIKQKLEILSDAAKYDVACTSSGVGRDGKKGETGNTMASGICHAFGADGRCISLLKILFTNECIYNCKYCINRCTNDIPRATFTPEEICTLTIEFYRRNYIEGLFLSSGIVESPDYTMELVCRTLHDLRTTHRFNGYIHCKAIPGASQELIEEAGWYADRMSINLELPTARGLQELAPNKSRKTILTPMRQIQNGMAESRAVLGMKGGNQSAYWHTQKRTGRALPGTQASLSASQNLYGNTGITEKGAHNKSLKMQPAQESLIPSSNTGLTQWNRKDVSRGFVPAGQSTQMIIGATGESDYEIIAVTEALYQRFDLKRVFFSAFINVNQDASLPAVNGQPPLRREHRLYQADFLLRYYGFRADELLTEQRPFFNTFLDPKCDWALSHLERFPVEINTADFDTLLRVPGIGTKSAQRIVAARKTGSLDYHALKAIGVVMKRAIYFITCNGQMMYRFLKIDEDYITRNLLENDTDVMKGFDEKVTYKQLSLFDAFPMEDLP